MAVVADSQLDALDAIADDPTSLRPALTVDVLDALLAASREPYTEDRTERLLHVLQGTLDVLDGDARRPAAVVAAVRVRARIAEEAADPMEQTALNAAVRALRDLPSHEELVELARQIFVGAGERSGERLSLDEAFFCFPEPAALPEPAAALRASLDAHATAAGWSGPA